MNLAQNLELFGESERAYELITKTNWDKLNSNIQQTLPEGSSQTVNKINEPGEPTPLPTTDNYYEFIQSCVSWNGSSVSQSLWSDNLSFDMVTIITGIEIYYQVNMFAINTTKMDSFGNGDLPEYKDKIVIDTTTNSNQILHNSWSFTPDRGLDYQFETIVTVNKNNNRVMTENYRLNQDIKVSASDLTHILPVFRKQVEQGICVCSLMYWIKCAFILLNFDVVSSNLKVELKDESDYLEDTMIVNVIERDSLSTQNLFAEINSGYPTEKSTLFVSEENYDLAAFFVLCLRLKSFPYIISDLPGINYLFFSKVTLVDNNPIEVFNIVVEDKSTMETYLANVQISSFLDKAFLNRFKNFVTQMLPHKYSAFFADQFISNELLITDMSKQNVNVSNTFPLTRLPTTIGLFSINEQQTFGLYQSDESFEMYLKINILKALTFYGVCENLFTTIVLENCHLEDVANGADEINRTNYREAFYRIFDGRLASDKIYNSLTGSYFNFSFSIFSPNIIKKYFQFRLNNEFDITFTDNNEAINPFKTYIITQKLLKSTKPCVLPSMFFTGYPIESNSTTMDLIVTNYTTNYIAKKYLDFPYPKTSIDLSDKIPLKNQENTYFFGTILRDKLLGGLNKSILKLKLVKAVTRHLKQPKLNVTRKFSLQPECLRNTNLLINFKNLNLTVQTKNNILTFNVLANRLLRIPNFDVGIVKLLYKAHMIMIESKTRYTIIKQNIDKPKDKQYQIAIKLSHLDEILELQLKELFVNNGIDLIIPPNAISPELEYYQPERKNKGNEFAAEQDEGGDQDLEDTVNWLKKIKANQLLPPPEKKFVQVIPEREKITQEFKLLIKEIDVDKEINKAIFKNNDLQKIMVDTINEFLINNTNPSVDEGVYSNCWKETMYHVFIKEKKYFYKKHIALKLNCQPENISDELLVELFKKEFLDNYDGPTSLNAFVNVCNQLKFSGIIVKFSIKTGNMVFKVVGNNVPVWFVFVEHDVKHIAMWNDRFLNLFEENMLNYWLLEKVNPNFSWYAVLSVMKVKRIGLLSAIQIINKAQK